MRAQASSRCAVSLGLVLVLTVLIPAGVAHAAREREGEAALHAVLRAEEGLLEATQAARRSNLAAQQSAATALAKAATTLGAALDAAAKLPATSSLPSDDDAARATAGVAAQQALVNAQLAHADAREGLERLLAESSRIEAQLSDRAARVDALRDGFERLGKSLPPRGAAEGDWTVTLAPLPEPLTFHLTQEGPFVGGTIEAGGTELGSVSGRFAGGQIRLERFDAAGVKVADLAGALAASGEIQGTWQSTVFGTGKPEAGTFIARRVP